MSNIIVDVFKKIGSGIKTGVKDIGGLFNDVHKADKLLHSVTPEVKTATANFLAAITKTVNDVQNAAGSEGLDIGKDEVIVTDVKAIVVAVKNDLPIIMDILKQLGMDFTTPSK